MRVIGIDPSLTATGIADADGGLFTITSKPDDGTVADRARRIATITAHLRPHRLTDAHLVVIEGPAFSRQGQAGVHLRAGLWWQVACLLTARGVEVVEIAPSALKKLATGKGNATKPDMRMALYQRAGIDERDDNRVDAWWLRQVGLHLLGDPAALDLPKTHLVALAKIRRPALDTEVPF